MNEEYVHTKTFDTAMQEIRAMMAEAKENNEKLLAQMQKEFAENELKRDREFRENEEHHKKEFDLRTKEFAARLAEYREENIRRDAKYEAYQDALIAGLRNLREYVDMKFNTVNFALAGIAALIALLEFFRH